MNGLGPIEVIIIFRYTDHSKIMSFGTPLRYPGGKGRLSSYMSKVISANGLIGGTYIEPYAGGAGMAINLLLDGVVSDIVLNDADRSVFAFWKCVTERTDELIDLIRLTEVTVDEWKIQREVQSRKESADILELGFSTFFLNRTNRSGILTGGMIGGKNQNGRYRIDARFNKDDLIARIERIGVFADHITVECSKSRPLSRNDGYRFQDRRMETQRKQRKTFGYQFRIPRTCRLSERNHRRLPSQFPFLQGRSGSRTISQQRIRRTGIHQQ